MILTSYFLCLIFFLNKKEVISKTDICKIFVKTFNNAYFNSDIDKILNKMLDNISITSFMICFAIAKLNKILCNQMYLSFQFYICPPTQDYFL